MSTVRGVAIAPPDAPVAVAASAVFEIRDVTRADAPSTVVGVHRQRDVPVAPGARLPFAIEVDEVDPRAAYTVRVHVDLDGSGGVSAGDLLTTRAYPALTRGAPVDIAIELTRV
jgi:putative lipoprotein